MTELFAVVAMSQNLVIGKNGTMPWHLPADLAHFRRLTWGKPCIMGRKVWDAIGHKALLGRQNIVLTRNHHLQTTGAELAHSPQQALALAKGAPEVAIIGGAEIYRLYWPQLVRLEITLIQNHLAGDAFWPHSLEALQKPQPHGKNWQIVRRYDRVADKNNAYDLTFLTMLLL